MSNIESTSLEKRSVSLERVREFIRRSKAESTLRGYRSDWHEFCLWCEEQGLAPMPVSPEAVAAYIGECAGRLNTDFGLTWNVVLESGGLGA